MRGVIIIDDRSDLAFYSLDKEMERFILGRVMELEEEAGAPTEEGKAPKKDLRDYLSEFFLPFFTSFGVLNSLKKPVSSITGADGHLIVFRKYGGDVYIGISKEYGETEETLGRKLCVLNRLIAILHGPVSHKLNPSDTNERAKTRSKLKNLLRAYETLYLTDQVFLVEALEHVQFGQLSAAANVVQKLTRDSLDSQHNGGIVGVKHAMLLANTKFLAMCGRSPRIETSDILLITLLVHHFFNSNEDEEAEDNEDSRKPKDYRSGEESDERNDLDQYATPRSTPGLGPKEGGSVKDYRGKTSAGGENNHHFELPMSAHNPKEAMSVNVASTRALRQRFRNALSSLRSFSHTRTAYSRSYAPDTPRLMEQLIFLQPHPGHYSPHFLYCLEVYPGIILVMVAEHGHLQNFAGHICQTILHLEATGIFAGIGKSISGSGQSMYEVLDESVRVDWHKAMSSVLQYLEKQTNAISECNYPPNMRIKDQINRECEKDKITDVEKIIALKNLSNRANLAWKNLKDADIRSYLERNDKGSSREDISQPARMEACGGDLKEKLLMLFETLFMSKRDKGFNASQVVKKLMHHFNTLNQDYGEFLALKGVFNIPIVSFSMSFPGMVHFLFIDRSFDELTSPSLATDDQVAISYVQKIAKDNGEHSAVFLRRKVWSMVQRVQKYLALGYTLQTWLDDDFLYTYFLWINLPSSASLGAPIRFYTPSNVKSTDNSAPGVIGSSFFGNIHTQREGYVYELYCLHEPKMPIREASLHCKSLAEQLWPSSREAVAPFSLIN